MISSAVFVVAVALQSKFPLSSKFSRNLRNMSKTPIHVLSTWGKYMTGFLVKSFWGVVEVQCWWVPLADRQVTVFLFRRLFRCDGVKSHPFSVGVRLRQWCVMSPLLFIVYTRVLRTTARGTNPTCEAISPGRKTHFAINEKIIYLRKMCRFGRM